MKFSTLSLATLTLLPSFLSVAALPAPNATPNEEGATLNKRGSEINYLVNCDAPYTVSHAAYYSNSDNSFNGQYPDALSNEYRNWSNGGGYLIWEGSAQNLYYPDSGVTLTTHIDSGASQYSYTTYAGWAQRSSDGKSWACYRDNNRQLFTSNGLTCWSIYWCM